MNGVRSTLINSAARGSSLHGIMGGSKRRQRLGCYYGILRAIQYHEIILMALYESEEFNRILS